jgi:hypothetical protein
MMRVSKSKHPYLTRRVDASRGARFRTNSARKNGTS